MKMKDRLTQFLYILVRDHVPFGVVNEIIATQMADMPTSYSNIHIEEWARSTVTKILRRGPYKGKRK